MFLDTRCHDVVIRSSPTIIGHVCLTEGERWTTPTLSPRHPLAAASIGVFGENQSSTDDIRIRGPLLSHLPLFKVRNVNMASPTPELPLFFLAGAVLQTISSFTIILFL